MLRIYNGRVLTKNGFERTDLWCDRGKIVAPADAAAESIDAQGLIVAPGYIDLQINGAYGVDFTTQPEKVGDAARKLPLHGVTAFLPTILSSPRGDYRRAINMLQPRPISEGASILGIHLEGPFFNPLYAGAHAKGCLATLGDGSDIHAYYGALTGVKIVTLAPELPHMLEAISLLKAKKIIAAIGHSAAGAEIIDGAVERGAGLITHLFNAMPPFHHRQPGLIDEALLARRVPYTLICDGVHLGRQAVKMAWALNPEGLILVSDAMEALGLPPGKHRLGQRDVVIEGQAARLAGAETLAGTVVGMDSAVRYLCEAAECSAQQAIEAASLRPAMLLGLAGAKGSLKVGADADFIFLDDALHVRAAFVLGRRLY